MKKFLSLLMAAVMVFALVACGGNTANTGSTNNSGSNSADTGDTGSDSGAITIKIGGIGPLTGDNAVYGLATDYGAQIAVDEINELGGNIQFEYDFQDDTGVGETAVSAYNALKDWDVDIIYGCTTTDPCISVAAETNSDRYFQLTPSASSTDVTAGKDNVFQMCFTDPGQGVAAGNYVVDNSLGTKIGVIYNNGSAYSTGIAESFISTVEAAGLEVVATETYPSDDNTDYNVQITACRDAGADLVFLPIYYTPASLILNQAKNQLNYTPTFFGGDGMDGILTMEGMPIYYTPASLILNQAKNMGYAPTFFGCDGMDGILAVEGFDTSLADGLMLLTPFNASATDEATVNFVTKYEEAYGETPNQFAADGYDCIYAIYEALQQVDNLSEIAAMDYAERHEALCDALIGVFTSAEFSFDGITGSGMTWGTNGEVSKDPIVVAVEDGVYVTQ